MTIRYEMHEIFHNESANRFNINKELILEVLHYIIHHAVAVKDISSWLQSIDPVPSDKLQAQYVDSQTPTDVPDGGVNP
uniref:Uncharacterized protein n=1 Tax=Rhizophagus irregularis (strain DAOM 181602 / DAOM 197198 / MUCL 43194) TaxID=747089 RepID=U9U0V9_RHIID